MVATDTYEAGIRGDQGSWKSNSFSVVGLRRIQYGLDRQIKRSASMELQLAFLRQHSGGVGRGSSVL